MIYMIWYDIWYDVWQKPEFMPNHVKFEIFMESKCDLCTCLKWPSAKFPSGDICNESEACGVL